MSVKLLYLAAVAAVMGCASASSKPNTARSGNLLTSNEIAGAHADVESAYDAVVRLRPNWLASHGVTSAVAGGAGTDRATVFVDGQAYGDINSLRLIPAYHVRDIRYYNVTEAGATFGIRAGSSGVIAVTMNLPTGSE